MTPKLTQGLVQVYTGDGKGKTTCALGLALRAVGRGFKVLMIQFLKGEESGERLAALRLAPEFTIRHFGRCGFIRKDHPDPQDVAQAQEALALAQQSIQSGEYDLVILDEINIALYFNLLSVAEVLDLLQSRPPQVEIVLTGRYAPPEIIAAADLVTEMKNLKHYYERGIPAREGIES
ncbi:MAG: cob(I)yrinic acid a,c-diamide adenosyltransferase [Deltaproteobacteria bacterium]|nr:cob(I)yrinic acid a,c-diamide adenosyltransferase [Deltaproteobacteria bacterium]MBW1951951.1 cob(I)yrinic acid a,c-diamide adenosyltransferase [Deltaproteobacteria bacterium]MBW1986727.1 cob(I)yrinic acid a,c-diamide adenosyltransferase [Deltaproteobacteria bacterium]MBW2134253.1 cob(I)yrinic acid a,c-diamide adenosyltransferase [Deltaproteobacteria bacterium]